MPPKSTFRVWFYVVVGLAGVWFLMPLIWTLTWHDAPVVGFLIGAPVLAWIVLAPIAQGVTKGIVWIAIAVLYPILTYQVALAQVAVAARGDPVPQRAMFMAFMAFVVSIIIAMGLLGHGLTMILKSRQPSQESSDPSIGADSQ